MTESLPFRGLARAASLVAITLLAACDGTGELSIHSLEPPSGRVQGDERVTIEGKNFRTDIGYTVYFGPSRSRKVAVTDPSTLVAFTPRADGPGSVDVVIRGEDGTTLRIVEGFAYQDAAAGEAPSAPAEAEEGPTLVY
jgi:hypothetical protein